MAAAAPKSAAFVQTNQQLYRKARQVAHAIACGTESQDGIPKGRGGLLRSRAQSLEAGFFSSGLQLWRESALWRLCSCHLLYTSSVHTRSAGPRSKNQRVEHARSFHMDSSLCPHTIALRIAIAGEAMIMSCRQKDDAWPLFIVADVYQNTVNETRNRRVISGCNPAVRTYAQQLVIRKKGQVMISMT